MGPSAPNLTRSLQTRHSGATHNRHTGRVKTILRASLGLIFIQGLNGSPALADVQSITVIQPSGLDGGQFTGSVTVSARIVGDRTLFVGFQDMATQSDYSGCPSHDGAQGEWTQTCTISKTGLNNLKIITIDYDPNDRSQDSYLEQVHSFTISPPITGPVCNSGNCNITNGFVVGDVYLRWTASGSPDSFVLKTDDPNFSPAAAEQNNTVLVFNPPTDGRKRKVCVVAKKGADSYVSPPESDTGSGDCSPTKSNLSYTAVVDFSISMLQNPPEQWVRPTAAGQYSFSVAPDYVSGGPFMALAAWSSGGESACASSARYQFNPAFALNSGFPQGQNILKLCYLHVESGIYRESPGYTFRIDDKKPTIEANALNGVVSPIDGQIYFGPDQKPQFGARVADPAPGNSPPLDNSASGAKPESLTYEWSSGDRGTYLDQGQAISNFPSRSGTFDLTFRGQDKAGNDADPVTVNSIRWDLTPPETRMWIYSLDYSQVLCDTGDPVIGCNSLTFDGPVNVTLGAKIEGDTSLGGSGTSQDAWAPTFTQSPSGGVLAGDNDPPVFDNYALKRFVLIKPSNGTAYVLAADMKDRVGNLNTSLTGRRITLNFTEKYLDPTLVSLPNGDITTATEFHLRVVPNQNNPATPVSVRVNFTAEGRAQTACVQYNNQNTDYLVPTNGPANLTISNVSAQYIAAPPSQCGLENAQNSRPVSASGVAYTRPLPPTQQPATAQGPNGYTAQLPSGGFPNNRVGTRYFFLVDTVPQGNQAPLQLGDRDSNNFDTSVFVPLPNLSSGGSFRVYAVAKSALKPEWDAASTLRTPLSVPFSKPTEITITGTTENSIKLSVKVAAAPTGSACVVVRYSPSAVDYSELADPRFTNNVADIEIKNLKSNARFTITSAGVGSTCDVQNPLFSGFGGTVIGNPAYTKILTPTVAGAQVTNRTVNSLTASFSRVGDTTGQTYYWKTTPDAMKSPGTSSANSDTVSTLAAGKKYKLNLCIKAVDASAPFGDSCSSDGLDGITKFTTTGAQISLPTSDYKETEIEGTVNKGSNFTDPDAVKATHSCSAGEQIYAIASGKFKASGLTPGSTCTGFRGQVGLLEDPLGFSDAVTVSPQTTYTKTKAPAAPSVNASLATTSCIAPSFVLDANLNAPQTAYKLEIGDKDKAVIGSLNVNPAAGSQSPLVCTSQISGIRPGNGYYFRLRAIHQANQTLLNSESDWSADAAYTKFSPAQQALPFLTDPDSSEEFKRVGATFFPMYVRWAAGQSPKAIGVTLGTAPETIISATDGQPYWTPDPNDPLNAAYVRVVVPVNNANRTFAAAGMKVRVGGAASGFETSASDYRTADGPGATKPSYAPGPPTGQPGNAGEMFLTFELDSTNLPGSEYKARLGKYVGDTPDFAGTSLSSATTSTRSPVTLKLVGEPGVAYAGRVCVTSTYKPGDAAWDLCGPASGRLPVKFNSPAQVNVKQDAAQAFTSSDYFTLEVRPAATDARPANYYLKVKYNYGTTVDYAPAMIGPIAGTAEFPLLFKVPAPAANTQYKNIRVQLGDNSGDLNWSAEKTSSNDGWTKPTQPLVPVKVGQTDTALTYTLDYPVANPSGTVYKLELSADLSKMNTVGIISEDTGRASPYTTRATLEPGVGYYAQLRAVSGKGDRAWDAVSDVTAQPAITNISRAVITNITPYGYTASWSLTSLAVGSAPKLKAVVTQPSGSNPSSPEAFKAVTNPSVTLEQPLGLKSNTPYDITLNSCDVDGNNCSPFPGSTGGTTTYAEIPRAPDVDMSAANGQINLKFVLPADNNSTDSEYAIQVAVDNGAEQYLNGAGALTGAKTWKTRAAWEAGLTSALPNAGQNKTIRARVLVKEKNVNAPSAEKHSDLTEIVTPGGVVTVSTAAIASVTSLDNYEFGVPLNGPFPIKFNTHIDVRTLAGRIRLFRVSDGQPVSVDVTDYRSRERTVYVKPVATLEPATAYKLSVTPGVEDFLNLNASVAALESPIYVTQINTGSGITIYSPYDTDRNFGVEVPAGNINYVIPRVRFINPPSTLSLSQSAVDGALGMNRALREIQRVEILLFRLDADGRPVRVNAPVKVTLKPTFGRSASGVASAAQVGARAAALSANDIDAASMAIYQVTPQGLQAIKDSKINADGSVSATVSNTGVYVLGAGISTSLDRAHPWPVPFKPSAGHTQITFENLAADSRIKIYTIMGELVRDLSGADADGRIYWDVKNSDGEKVASGVYLYQIKNAYSEKRGKLMVIR